MTSSQIREDFLRFFEGKAHIRVASAPVVPHDDPTLLFTNAGMNQFKDVFLGAGSRDYTRVANTQKCIRVSGKHNDLEEVGISPRHHTFFEMLGNWSFGDYFKREAISWAWELLTEVWKLPKERFWVTVFAGDEAVGLEADEESAALWTEVTDLAPDRVLRFGMNDNFWEMGETGPCGLNSEIHYYIGDDLSKQGPELVNVDGSDCLELWNLVFIQFNRDASGHLTPLPAKHVDTGMGFERLCSVLQGVRNNYDTDLFQPILAAVGDLTRAPYNEQNRVAFRVIADHVRALTVAIADGVIPSNEGRGYVIRRILRRAARFGRNLDIHEPFIYRLTDTIAKEMGDTFPEIRDQADYVARVIQSEEEGFGRTLDRGLELFEEISSDDRISGEDAFRLYDTYGFPIDLTQLMAGERGMEVDLEGFQREMEAQQTRSREAGRGVFTSQVSEGSRVSPGALVGEHSEFVGFDTLAADARVVSWQATEGGGQEVVLDATPFYAESGGQVGDRGVLRNGDLTFEVSDTQRVGETIVHLGKVTEGDPEALTGLDVSASVDRQRRLGTARNHTATHLLHAALRKVLGSHVRQAGSLVTPDRLRFDFTHFTGVEKGQLDEIEGIANESIRLDMGVEISYLDLEKAREQGATMLFSEKYGDIVRSVRIGDVSFELCGGTHVESTGQLGLMLVPVETGTAAGVRRIEALTGSSAEARTRSDRTALETLSLLLNVPADEMPVRVEQLLAHNRELGRELQSIRRNAAASNMEDLVKNATDVDGFRVTAEVVEAADVDSLRDMADRLREALSSGVGVLGANLDGKASLVAVVTDDLISRGIQAGPIVKEVAKVVEGGGGGKPHLAQAGGRRPEKLHEAIDGVTDVVRAQLQG